MLPYIGEWVPGKGGAGSFPVARRGLPGQFVGMKQIFFASLFWFCALPVFAQPQITALNDAMRLKNSGDWDGAIARAQAAGLVAVDIIEWHRLRASAGRFDETREFLNRRADWPGLPLLRKRSEQSIPAGANPAQIFAYFSTQAPRTATGSLRLAEAFEATGRRDDAVAEIRRAWAEFPMSEAEEGAIRQRFAAQLKDLHEDRLDMLLWAGHQKQALRILPDVDAGFAHYARARLAVQTDADGMAQLIGLVPRALRNRPGLVYDRFIYRATNQNREGAVELLLNASRSAETLGQPEKWGFWRRRLARQWMREGKSQIAYNIAANHQLTTGDNYADLEWIAGYIALRKLNRPSDALRHFQRHQAAIYTPISQARTHYWQGRAWAAMGNSDEAMRSYRKGAEHQTAFYGLLSAEAAGVPMDPNLIGVEQFPNWRQAAFTRSSVFDAGVLLMEAGQTRLGTRFLTHLAESLSRDEIGQLATMARERDWQYLEVHLAKRAVKHNRVMVEGPYFPLHPLAERSGNVPPEMALAIARRESEFLPTATSGVGASGLMQLMPGTAKEMAGKLNLTYSPARLTQDPAFNTTLGIAYLAELQEEFGRSPVQIAVAYNAGPGRARKWTRDFGDPRNGSVDVIDWIEHIPFDETRNYVMRVTESLPIYRARLTGQTAPINFLQELRGQFIAPAAPAAPSTSLRPRARN